jgi:hypothetical protein
VPLPPPHLKKRNPACEQKIKIERPKKYRSCVSKYKTKKPRERRSKDRKRLEKFLKDYTLVTLQDDGRCTASFLCSNVFLDDSMEDGDKSGQEEKKQISRLRLGGYKWIPRDIRHLLRSTHKAVLNLKEGPPLIPDLCYLVHISWWKNSGECPLHLRSIFHTNQQILSAIPDRRDWISVSFETNPDKDGSAFLKLVIWPFLVNDLNPETYWKQLKPQTGFPLFS